VDVDHCAHGHHQLCICAATIARDVFTLRGPRALRCVGHHRNVVLPARNVIVRTGGFDYVFGGAGSAKAGAGQ